MKIQPRIKKSQVQRIVDNSPRQRIEKERNNVESTQFHVTLIQDTIKQARVFFSFSLIRSLLSKTYESSIATLCDRVALRDDSH